jgi:hypothetical protein
MKKLFDQYPLDVVTNCSLECSICKSNYDQDDVIIRLPCFHVFHNECAREWLVSHHTCPECNVDLISKQNESDVVNK